MAKKDTEKDRKNRTTPAVAESTGRFRALRTWFGTKIRTIKSKKRDANESIEMTQRNLPTSASNEQPGKGQAVRDWFSSSFGRKARGLILFFVSFESRFWQTD